MGRWQSKCDYCGTNYELPGEVIEELRDETGRIVKEIRMSSNQIISK